MHAELLVDMLHVCSDSVLREDQFISDIGLGATFCKVFKYLPLAGRQAESLRKLFAEALDSPLIISRIG